MIQVVFQNSHFIICNKAANTLSVPARDANDSRWCLGTELQKKLNTQIFPVHRLDYEVSGLIIYALSAKAHKASQDWFLNKIISKKYVATTALQNFSHWPTHVNTVRDGVVLEIGKKLIWKTQMLKGKKRTFESAHGEWAETHAEISLISAGRLNWNLYPITGKSHQLRFELSRRGFPVVGDKLYGSNINHTDEGIGLKAIEINLTQVSNKMGLPEVISI